MTNQFILSRVYKKLTFSVGPYQIPKVILPKKPGPIINLQDLRQNQLVRDQTNPNNQGFEIFLTMNPDLPATIRELPVIAPQESGRNFYLLDYFFPTLGLAIELDSRTYHDRKKDLEKNRDLMTLGIDVLRFYGFWDPTQRKDLSEVVRKAILGRRDLGYAFPMDYTTRLIQDFRGKYRRALDILESKPMSGIDQNLYILSPEEEQECKECLRILGI